MCETNSNLDGIICQPIQGGKNKHQLGVKMSGWGGSVEKQAVGCKEGGGGTGGCCWFLGIVGGNCGGNVAITVRPGGV